jgi:hypothetical protein
MSESEAYASDYFSFTFEEKFMKKIIIAGATVGFLIFFAGVYVGSRNTKGKKTISDLA